MTVAVIGGGMLGLTLALRLARRGHRVTLLEAAPQLGGLAAPQNYGEFVWDRFYHCVLPRDTAMLALLDELGLGDAVRWNKTGTGYYGRGTMFPMNGTADFLRFPLLGFFDKARLGAAIVYATRIADPEALHDVTAEAWLTKICGARGYRAFWRPLLRAKFGPYHDRVAATFIYATLARLHGARKGAAKQEVLGYVSGGYARILAAIETALHGLGAEVLTGTPVVHIERHREGAGQGVHVHVGGSCSTRRLVFDRVVFTAPTRLARQVAAGDFADVVEQAERDHPTGEHYLGVICHTLVLPEPLTPYYVLNIGEENIALTGLIEMTNLVDRHAETNGRALVYLPRYLASHDRAFEEDDASLARSFVDDGLRRIFPAFDPARAIYAKPHRARQVQPLPLAGARRARSGPPGEAGPFAIVNTSMLSIATLNNNEVVELADRFLQHAWREPAEGGR